MKIPYSLICVISLSLISVSCFQSKPSASVFDNSVGIINGQPVDQSSIASSTTARILIVSGEYSYWLPVCTASILSEDLILTAAHCVNGNTNDTVRIGFGVEPLTIDSQINPDTRIDVLEKFITLEVTGIIIHPQYTEVGYDHDMALIRVSGKIPEGFQPIPLLSTKQSQSIKEGTIYQVLLAGYGLLSEEPIVESSILRQTNVSAQFEGLHLVTDQTQGSGGCHGDSGGPAYLEMQGAFYLVGVTHGPLEPFMDCHHAGVWGNPSLEKEFLNRAAEKLQSNQRFH